MSGVSRVGDRIVAVIEDQPWLDTPGYKLEHGLALTFNLLGSRGRGVQDVLHGRWLGHPLHPVLTDIPIGAWTTALLLDAADAASPRPGPYRGAARLAVGTGVLGGAAAALSGLTDWQHTQDRPRRSGLVHGLLNSAALALNLASWRDRRHGRDNRARLSSGLGYGLVLASSYLGGNLVFRHRIEVAHGQDVCGPREFLDVLADAELEEDTPRRVEVGGVGVVLIRHADRINAVGELCSHLGAPLGQGWLYRDTLVCPWHGSRFELDTGCPAVGPATAPLLRYETRVRAGRIAVRAITAHPRVMSDSQPVLTSEGTL